MHMAEISKSYSDVFDGLGLVRSRVVAKHTPGPWTFDSISMGSGDCGISQRDLKISICHVHNAASFGEFVVGAMKRGGDTFDQRDAHTQRANALLIAAAPDLLAALQRIISDLREQEETGLCKRMRINQIVDIDAAIRKATA